MFRRTAKGDNASRYYFLTTALRAPMLHSESSIDNICAELDASGPRLLTSFAAEDQLQGITDVFKIDKVCFYKFNVERTLAWLTVKARRVAETLRSNKVNGGHFAQSANYVQPSDEVDQEQQECNLLRMACDIVGSYVSSDIHEALLKNLNLADAKKVLKAEKNNSNKRKSQNTLLANDTKKPKVDAGDQSIKLNAKSNERTLTIKEKQLAKGAKGTRSIVNFFRK